MKHLAIKPFFSALLFTALITQSGLSSAADNHSLKQTMKQMRLAYKEALVSSSAEGFNQQVDAFRNHLSNAQAYDFSPERKAIALEGLNKVEHSLDNISLATADNLSELQEQLRSIDQLRKEYHKKAKPSTWELILSLFK